MMLVWMDLETTGLDPGRDRILEMAVAFATLDRPFDVIAAHEWVFPYIGGDPSIDPVVIDMHTRNGLWAECARAIIPAAQAESAMLDWVPEVGDWEEKPTLAGNCVGFDHAFLKTRMPRLADRFHYRHYDVSSVKLFCRSLGMPRLPASEAHRAMHDVKESIAQAVQCKDWLAARTLEGMYRREP